MIGKPETLIEAARVAKIPVPDDLRKYDRKQFAFWHLLCVVQLDRVMPNHDSHITNALTIASIPDDEIVNTTYNDIKDRLE